MSDRPMDRTLVDPAEVMKIVHEEADVQNHWDILGVSFLSLDQETGIVRFRHGAGTFGTAWFRYDPENEAGDRVLFQHGHYDLDWPTSARSFCERLQKAA
jgi:hypothetical protein